jgi:hypothetical protein
MNGPFRIYYESYEQAAHYLLPALLKIVPHANFELVRLSKITKSSKSTVADSIVKSLLFKNPDSLFTVIHNNKEYPLAWLEISTAVETEDHDLQRFDSIVSASLSNILSQGPTALSLPAASPRPSHRLYACMCLSAESRRTA